MLEFVTMEHSGELDSFVMSHPRCHYMQTSCWGKLKTDWDWIGILSRNEKGEIRGSVAVLLHQMRGTKLNMLYAPRGPICDWEDKETFEELMDGVRQVGRERHGYLFRMDPQVFPEQEDIRKRIENQGFTIDPIDDFSAFQARVVYQIDIDGRTKEEIMETFARTARYNVRLAGRKGVESRICGKEALPDFCEMMKVTAHKDGFAPKSQGYFERFLDAFGPYGRLFMAYVDGTPIAGNIGVQMGGKTWDAYACSDESHRNLKGSDLLKWSMISWAADEGCSLYDFRGVEGFPTEDNPMLGLHKFKQGFGGHLVAFMGQMDLPLRKDWKLIQGAQSLYAKLRK